MSIDWENLSAEIARTGEIRELYLSKIPHLKNTTNWKKIVLVGWIDHQMKLSYYKGGIVKLNEKLYFVQENTIRALQEFMEWNFPQRIRVIH